MQQPCGDGIPASNLGWHRRQDMVIPALCPEGVTPLWTTDQMESWLVDERLPAWVRTSYSTFVATIRDTAFPCFYATRAEHKGLIRYLIAASSTEPQVVEHTLEGVYKFLAEAQAGAALQRQDNDLLTLVIFFPPEPQVLTVQAYARQAYDFLNALHALDVVPWPEGWPTNPYTPGWSYALGGRALFVNVSTPANHQRRSRNLGPGLTMIVSLSDAVYSKAGGPDSLINRRVQQYDSLPPHPNLLISLSDHKPGATVTLYALPDDNDSELPFVFHF